jgi:hypothetical protein
VVTIRFGSHRDAINRDGGIAANVRIECNGEIDFLDIDRRMNRIDAAKMAWGD